ncbi:MAG: tripartite tricarboxylate transporter substrate binding protein [Xanthobacteraceae bacterium]
MKLPRRKVLHLAAVAAALPAASRMAKGESYPTRQVHIIVPFAPGITPDILARLFGQWLSERLGQPFVVENRPGAGANVGTELVAKAAPDGYTLLLVTFANAVNATLYDNLNFDFIRDIVPVASLGRSPVVMEVNPSFPAQTVPEFIAYAKANPGKINMASGGNGVPSHVAGELFKMMARVDMLHVPYRNGNPLPDLLGGQVQVYFSPIPASIGFIRAGKLRALAVTGATRSEVLPDIPTVAEFIPGYEAMSWYGVGAPKNTPADIVDKLNKEINTALADPAIHARLADLGVTVLAGSPGAFGKFLADEIQKWGKVVKFANIKVD